MSIHYTIDLHFLMITDPVSQHGDLRKDAFKGLLTNTAVSF